MDINIMCETERRAVAKLFNIENVLLVEYFLSIHWYKT